MWVKLLLLFLAFSFLLKSDQSFNQDLGRHLKVGKIVLQTLQVPKTNLFSYTNPDFEFINTHWLFGVLMFLLSQSIGLQALLYLKIITYLLSVWLILKIIPNKNEALLLPIGFIFFHVLRERTDLRPEIFSFLFTAATYYILELSLRPRTRFGGSNLLFFLPLIQLIWVNTHIYFFVGLILQSIFFIQLIYQQLRSHIASPPRFAGEAGGKLKLLGVIFTLSVLLCFLNPNGIKGVLYPLNVNSNYGYTIVENQTMFLLESINFKDPNFLFVKIAALIVILSVMKNLFLNRLLRRFAPRNDSDLEFKNILISSLGLGLALLHVRSFPYLVFLSLPAVSMNFGEIKKNWLTKFLLLVTICLLLVESFMYLNGSYYKLKDDYHTNTLTFSENTKGAIDFVISHNLQGPIYNNFDIGGYIIYRGYPKLKVFVDGRPEAYPRDFFTNTYIPTQSDYPKFKELEKQWGFKTIIFSHTDQTPWGANFLKEVIKDPEWSLVYIDDFMVVLVKKLDLQKLNLKKVELATLNPDDYNFDNHVSYLRLGFFLINSGYPQLGVVFIQEAHKKFPDSPTTNNILGNVTQQIEYLNKAKQKIFW